MIGTQPRLKPRAARGATTALAERPLVRAAWAVVLGGIGIMVLAPIAYMLLISLEPLATVYSRRFLPAGLEFSNYLRAWRTVNLAAFMLHTIIVAIGAVVLCVSVALLCAFVLARYHFRFRSAVSTAILVTQFVPAVTLLLPIYVLYSEWKTITGLPLIGTFPGLILVDAAVALPLAIWLLIGQIRSIPRELDEAAFCDGATTIKAFLHVVVPAALPGIAVAGIFSFLAGWNDVLFASVLTSHATRTLAIGLQQFSVSTSSSGSAILWNELMAGAFMSSVPAAAFFFFAQRYLVSGLTTGAIR